MTSFTRILGTTLAPALVATLGIGAAMPANAATVTHRTTVTHYGDHKVVKKTVVTRKATRRAPVRHHTAHKVTHRTTVVHKTYGGAHRTAVVKTTTVRHDNRR